MSLFDLLVAQALLEGMARGGTRGTPPPKNFYVLQQNTRSWQGLQEICKKGNNVIAVEVTNGELESCRRMQQVFLNLAREHDELGFFRAEIEQPGFTFPEVTRARVCVCVCLCVPIGTTNVDFFASTLNSCVRTWAASNTRLLSYSLSSGTEGSRMRSLSEKMKSSQASGPGKLTPL